MGQPCRHGAFPRFLGSTTQPHLNMSGFRGMNAMGIVFPSERGNQLTPKTGRNLLLECLAASPSRHKLPPDCPWMHPWVLLRVTRGEGVAGSVPLPKRPQGLSSSLQSVRRVLVGPGGFEPTTNSKARQSTLPGSTRGTCSTREPIT